MGVPSACDALSLPPVPPPCHPSNLPEGHATHSMECVCAGSPKAEGPGMSERNRLMSVLRFALSASSLPCLLAEHVVQAG